MVWKQILYDLGWYRFEVPPVSGHHAWSREQWITWIDSHGEWLPVQGKIPFFMPQWLRIAGAVLEDPLYYDAGTRLMKDE